MGLAFSHINIIMLVNITMLMAMVYVGVKIHLVTVFAAIA